MNAMRYKPKRIVLAVVLFLLFPVAGIVRPYLCGDYINVCIFYGLTDKPCPFCGLTRAVACATICDFKAAFSHHPLWWLAVIIIFTIALTLLIDGFRGTNFLNYFARLWDIPLWMIFVILVTLTLFRWLIS